MPNPKVIMLGSGGHARVLQETLSLLGFELDGYVAPGKENSRLSEKVVWFGADRELLETNPLEVVLVNGVGSVGTTETRTAIFEKYKKAGFKFMQVVSDKAIVADSAVLGEGVQVMHGAVVNTDAFIDGNSIINTGAIVEHHTRIGVGVHVATGAVICGDVEIGDGAHIGAGAKVIQGLKIGAKSIVGAGAVVIREVPNGHTAVGVPAQIRPNKV